MSLYFRPILVNAFPEETWPPIVYFFAEGVAIADAEIRDTPMLNWTVGRDQRGDLRRVGVMYSVYQACLRGDLPFKHRIKDNIARNCHYLEVISDNVYSHISQTPYPGSFPKDMPYRRNERARNQLNLFDNHSNIIHPDYIPSWYGQMTFRADTNGKLTHVCIGLPEANRDEWLDRINLLVECRELTVPDRVPEAPASKARVQFKDFAKEYLKNTTTNNGKKDEK